MVYLSHVKQKGLKWHGFTARRGYISRAIINPMRVHVHSLMCYHGFAYAWGCGSAAVIGRMWCTPGGGVSEKVIGWRLMVVRLSLPELFSIQASTCILVYVGDQHNTRVKKGVLRSLVICRQDFKAWSLQTNNLDLKFGRRKHRVTPEK